MPAILAKKIGMTQRFLDDGRVERVTVLEAGPCPVTAIRTIERDGYEAVQLAFGACKEKALTRPELGHLKKADTSAHRHLCEFRNEAGELLFGEPPGGCHIKFGYLVSDDTFTVPGSRCFTPISHPEPK